jgi:Flp pilus assembly pilin Flp
MMNKMSLKKFMQDDQASVNVEYVILVAFAAILLAGGAYAMFDAMGNFFNTWAGFFSGSWSGRSAKTNLGETRGKPRKTITQKTIWEEQNVESIKRFFKDEAGTAELSSEVIMIAFVATALLIGLGLYYNAFDAFYTGMATAVGTATTAITGANWGPS